MLIIPTENQLFQSFSYYVKVVFGLNVSLLHLGIFYMISLHFRVAGQSMGQDLVSIRGLAVCLDSSLLFSYQL